MPCAAIPAKWWLSSPAAALDEPASVYGEPFPESYKGATCYYGDSWEAYRGVLPEDRHQATGKQEGESCHMERWINTLSRRLSRFVRKALSFSKSRRMHVCCLKLFICRYNPERRSIIRE